MWTPTSHGLQKPDHWQWPSRSYPIGRTWWLWELLLRFHNWRVCIVTTYATSCQRWLLSLWNYYLLPRWFCVLSMLEPRRVKFILFVFQDIVYVQGISNLLVDHRLSLLMRLRCLVAQYWDKDEHSPTFLKTKQTADNFHRFEMTVDTKLNSVWHKPKMEEGRARWRVERFSCSKWKS